MPINRSEILLDNQPITRPSRYERLLVALVLVSLLLLPLPFGGTPELAQSVMMMWFWVLGFLWAIHLLRPGVRAFVGKRLTRVALLTIGLLLVAQAWVALQLFWTLSHYHTLRYFELGMVYTLVFAMILSLFYTRKRLVALLAVLIISGTFQAFYGAMMVLTQIEMIWAYQKVHYLGNATGTFINRNHLAGYLEMTLAAGIGLMLALRSGQGWSWRGLLELLLSNKLLIRLALVVMVIGLVMTQSRMGNTAFVISLIIAGAVFIAVSPSHRFRNGLILLSIIIIDVLIISQFFGLERLKDRLTQTEVTVTSEGGNLVVDVNDLRSLAFKQSIPLALEKPFIGQGAGTYEIAFMSYAGLSFGGHHDHAHQDYLQFWIENGALGMLPLVLFILIVIWFALKAMRMRQSLFRSGLGFGMMMALIAIGIHSLSDFNLQIPANALTFVVICAATLLTVFHRKTSLVTI
jgi:O-antigen ligase